MSRFFPKWARRAGAVGLLAALATATAGVAPAAATTPQTLAFSQLDGATGIATSVGVDAAGNIYYSGTTGGGAGITTTPGAFRPTPQNGVGTFVVSTDPSGAQIRYATYFPGGIADLAVNPNGTVVVAGGGGSFVATAGAFQPQDNNGGGDYVAELDATGSHLVYASYLSGMVDPATNRGGNDSIAAVAVDPQGNAYVTGTTDSTNQSNFPITRDASQPRNTAPDANNFSYLTVVSPTGGLVYGTFLGERTPGLDPDGGNTFGYGVAADASGVYLTGLTGPSFPTTANLRALGQRKGQSLFVTKFRRNTTQLGAAYSQDYSVLAAGSARAFAIAVDGAGSAYVTGEIGTNGPGFAATAGAFQAGPSTTATSTDSFVIKLTANGRYDYATYLGGNGEDQGRSIAVDPQGQAWVGGLTESDAFPVTPNAYQSHRVRTATLPDDGFVTGLNPTGTALVYSTLLTGSGRGNHVNGITVNNTAVYVVGDTTSADFPDSPGGLSNGFCCTGNEFASDGFLAGFR